MGKHEALKRAQELWGNKAAVEYKPKRTNKKTGKVYPRKYSVGTIENIILPMFFVHGQSNKSWEDAFKRAAEH